MPFTIELANATDLDQLVELESALFREDAGVHEPDVDVAWPEREGRADFERLLGDDSCVVLVARADDHLVGFLAGYKAGPSPTRPVLTAYLRSIYVRSAERRSGIAADLTDRFVQWAIDQGCTSAAVDSYAANDSAQQLYESLGFVVQSVHRVRRLG